MFPKTGQPCALVTCLSRRRTWMRTMWGEPQALALLAEAGFTHVAVRQVEGDPWNNYDIARTH
jgi:hypothetical protein